MSALPDGHLPDLAELPTDGRPTRRAFRPWWSVVQWVWALVTGVEPRSTTVPVGLGVSVEEVGVVLARFLAASPRPQAARGLAWRPELPGVEVTWVARYMTLNERAELVTLCTPQGTDRVELCRRVPVLWLVLVVGASGLALSQVALAVVSGRVAAVVGWLGLWLLARLTTEIGRDRDEQRLVALLRAAAQEAGHESPTR